MAVDLCSETSPRISFSYDLVNQTDIDNQNKSRLDSSLLIDSSFDFEFNIHHQYQSWSSADELFSNGLILPIQIQERKKSDTPPKRGSLPPRPEPSSTTPSDSKKENLKKSRVANCDPDEEKPHHTNIKSFWGFKRSTSLNGGYENVSKMSLIFALPILSRSSSTGSASSASSSSSMKHNSHKVPSIPMSKSNNNSKNNASNGFYACKTKQKVKKNYTSSYGQVLNVPPPYISKRAASLFGLGSFFSNDKKNKKSF